MDSTRDKRMTLIQKEQASYMPTPNADGEDFQNGSYENKRVYVSATKRKDANSFGTDKYTEPTLKYKCNVDGSYKITDAYGNTTTDLLIGGMDYYESVVKILHTNDTAVDSGDITVFW